uniref:Uncharacterized protein n=1 Tax=Chenopodium quinoa TaxID=63459 RepID=A0A803N4T0_CHEQI
MKQRDEQSNLTELGYKMESFIIDWDNLFPENKFHFFSDVPPSLEDEATTGIAKENTIESWIEELLMKDDDEHNINQAQAKSGNDFRWSDLLLDTPQPPDEQRVYRTPILLFRIRIHLLALILRIML